MKMRYITEYDYRSTLTFWTNTRRRSAEVYKRSDEVIMMLARFLLPEIQKAYESAEGQAEFEKWKSEYADSQTDKHNEK